MASQYICSTFRASVFCALVGVIAAFGAGSQDKLKPEDIVAGNLASIGTPLARAAVRTRVAEGNAIIRFVQGGVGGAAGPVTLVSEGERLRFQIRPGEPGYRGEEFAFDGRRVQIGFTHPGPRSFLEDFVYQCDASVGDGLISGTLATAWPFLALQDPHFKLDYQGLKNLEGRRLHKLSYRPRKGSCTLSIDLYFEPETFRHVRTEIAQSLGPGMVFYPHGSVGKPVNWQGLQEEFSDFKTVDGLTLPTHWKMELAKQASILEIEMNFTSIRHNVPLEPDVLRLQ